MDSFKPIQCIRQRHPLHRHWGTVQCFSLHQFVSISYITNILFVLNLRLEKSALPYKCPGKVTWQWMGIKISVSTFSFPIWPFPILRHGKLPALRYCATTENLENYHWLNLITCSNAPAVGMAEVLRDVYTVPTEDLWFSLFSSWFPSPTHQILPI